MSKLSLAKSLKNFFDRLPSGSGGSRNVRKAISEAFSIEENSAEMQLLLYTQMDNFERLLVQVRLSSIENDAKRRYLKDIGTLSAIVHYPRLFQSFETARSELIDRHAHTLTYLNDALKVGDDLHESIDRDIDELSRQLQDVLEELSSSDLPLKVRGILFSQISQLLFLLKNFQSVGVDKVWEVASATYVTIQKEAATIATSTKSGFLKRAAVGISALVGALAIVEAGTSHVIGTAKNLEKGIELIEKWRGEVPQIEYKPSSTTEGGVVAT
ncbi:hypothetical protein [Bradyrhizobium sp. G127]|uniref:hypothetical protein n=1 Tax=Bradyrhizobium sp. G127 TaxID=2904800 RepID=UPI001F2AF0BF|nr:hypothetical protein [Bradyrhizobium sp. G127]MCF2524075.1 hypothetical protein [Bradyrhizobium sp. G127]